MGHVTKIICEYLFYSMNRCVVDRLNTFVQICLVYIDLVSLVMKDMSYNVSLTKRELTYFNTTCYFLYLREIVINQF